MQLPQEEFNPYYLPYINSATSSDLVGGLKQNLKSVVAFYDSIPEEKLEYAYAEGKWTVKDILLHIIDTERIFAYRAMRVARQDKTALAGFEQDDYVNAANASNRTIESLLEEYKVVRNATISLFESFTDESLKAIGTASGSPISTRAIGYIITGHENHHNTVIRERYL
ncbi:DinB family protein [Winogradskyella haliclonae]|uniref:DNA damage-inducible protein DinB n=1 Tax=Winogradskyella haliclonae TaxID=2048558 RepID=A0ABQ2C0V2_9FLAO|nr:DinB family protein [Winogradskyella haliclonae]GGI57402.1 DNA damage-inducible protein DinB [Winogradskyella haliclonae]